MNPLVALADPYFLLGILSFLVFLAAIILIRVGRDPSPYRAVARTHLKFSLFYVAAASVWFFTHPGAEIPWGKIFIGFFTYFALQYAFFAHVFATIIRGFSTNICIAIYQKGGRIPIASCL